MAQKGGESKRGLIVTLVFCILIIIGLGVSTYLGFSDQEALRAKAVDAENKRKEMSDDRDWVRFQALLTKAYVGVALSKAEQEDLTVLGGRWQEGKLGGKDSDKEQINNNLKALVNDPDLGGPNPATKAPKQTMRAKIKELADALANKTKLMDETVAAKEDTIAKLEGLIKTKDAAIAQATENIKAAKDELTKEKATYIAAIKKEQDRYDELSVKAGEDKKKLDKEKAEVGTQLASAQKEIKGLKKNLEQRTDEITQASPISLVGRENSNWRILSIDRNGTPLINLGSADHVTPKLTFDVYGIGPDGRASRDRKATAEVTYVVGPHLSQVRLVYQIDPERERQILRQLGKDQQTLKDEIERERDALRRRNPVVPGDMLFHPIWNPDYKKHVAIAGLIDLIGTGPGANPDQQLRNVLEFKRLLESHNMVVDAYFDPKTLKEEGEISRQTDFLILDHSADTGTVALDKGDRTSKINKGIAELQRQAAQNAVKVVKVREVLESIGYKVPTTGTEISTSTPRGATGPATAVAPPPERKEPEKKEPEKKDGDK